MKSGFMLIELLVATAIASMLSLALFVAWNQVNRGVISADNRISFFDRMILMRKQFEQDFTGMCVPVSRPYLKEQAAEKEATPGPAQPVSKEESKKEKPKPVERVFYATNHEDMFASLTCLTDNPLQVYWSDRTGAPRPRIARIRYSLSQDPKTEKRPTYTLYRQEAYTLDNDVFQKDSEKSARAYALVTGIKELKLTYWQEIEVEKDVKTGETTKKEKAKEVKKLTAWDLEKEQPPKGSFIRPLPIRIQVHLVLWDMQKKKSQSFTYFINIPITIDNPADKKKTEAPAQSAAPQSGASQAQPLKTQAMHAQTSQMPPGLGVQHMSGIPTNVQSDAIITVLPESPLQKLLKRQKEMSGKSK